MMGMAVYCVMSLRMAVPCELPEPVQHEPIAFHYGKATDRSWPEHIRKLRPPEPTAFPIISKRPEKPAERAKDVLATVAPAKGLARVTEPKLGGKLYAKADGNESTSCLSKNKRLWRAMNQIRDHFGRPLIIESAYRSPAYNAALRKNSKNVARNSYHTRCAAIDFRIRGVSMTALRKYVVSLKSVGGVGTYRSWIHIDTGPRRYW